MSASLSPTFALDPSETALVLIEYQNEFTTPGGKLHDAVKEVMSQTRMLDNSVKLTDALRRAGCTIIHCPISFEPVRV
jgi:nicotinamidase-related amidase